MATTLAEHLNQSGFDSLGLGALEGGKEFKRFMESAAFDIYAGPARHLNDFMVLRYGTPLAATYTVTCHTLTAISAAGETLGAVFAFTYWRPGASEPEYVCVGPTYLSQDGEYRNGLMWWGEFAARYEQPRNRASAELQNRLELWFAGREDSGAARVDVATYPRADSAERGRVLSRIDELRIPTKLAIAGILFYSLLAGGREIHANPNYQKVFNSLWEASEIDNSELTPEVIKHIYALRIGNAARTMSVGQKIIPISIADAVRVGDVRSRQWREIWVARALSDLALNGRGHFPLFNNWTTVRGANAQLYENAATQQRYAESAAAKTIIRDLQAARRLALADGHNNSSRMAAVGAKIYDSERLIEESVIVADTAIVTTQQHVGITLGSVLDAAGAADSVLRGDNSLKLLFDLAFSCLSMHEVCCHADLHAHNVTVYLQKRGQNENSALYAASPRGEKDAFVVPLGVGRGSTAYIIDASRAIVSPQQRGRLEREQGAEQTAALYRAQAGEILAVAERWLPEFAREHQEAIKGAALLRPQHAHDAICMVDYLALGRDFTALYAAAELDGQSTNETAAEAARRLTETAQGELIRRLLDLIAGRDVAPAAEAGVRFLHALAPHWRFAVSPGRHMPMAAAYSVAAPMTSSGDDPSRFPLCTRPEELLKYSPGKKITDILSRGDQALYNAFARRAAREDTEDLDENIEKMRAALSERTLTDVSRSWLV